MEYLNSQNTGPQEGVWLGGGGRGADPASSAIDLTVAGYSASRAVVLALSAIDAQRRLGSEHPPFCCRTPHFPVQVQIHDGGQAEGGVLLAAAQARQLGRVQDLPLELGDQAVPGPDSRKLG
ncbi:hypothetical protein J6590_063372 [Homalodisca vitripennis]|nr:hypothetical protein J6590_063372 [Homalodisca vitripennis]